MRFRSLFPFLFVFPGFVLTQKLNIKGVYRLRCWFCNFTCENPYKAQCKRDGDICFFLTGDKTLEYRGCWPNVTSCKLLKEELNATYCDGCTSDFCNSAGSSRRPAWALTGLVLVVILFREAETLSRESAREKSRIKVTSPEDGTRETLALTSDAVADSIISVLSTDPSVQISELIMPPVGEVF